jgi:hypothetical protein
MQGRYPSVILVVLERGPGPGVAAAEPAELRLARPTTALGHSARYVEAVPGVDAPAALTIHELSPSPPGERARLSDVVRAEAARSSTLFAAECRRVGPEFRSDRSERETAGILVVGTNRRPPAPQEAFDDWYNRVHVPQILATGLYHTAYRYEVVQAGHFPGRYLAIYETEQDPWIASQALAEYRDRWADLPGYGDPTTLCFRSPYRAVPDPRPPVWDGPRGDVPEVRMDGAV